MSFENLNLFDQTLTSADILVFVLIALGVLFLVFLFVLLEVFVFSKKRMQKKYNEFHKKYNYLHDLVTSQDKQYIERIDSISRTNLLYTDVYNKYLEIYKEIKDKYDEPLSIDDANLEIACAQKNGKDFKRVYAEASILLNSYNDEALKFNEELILVIKPEEDCRNSSLMLKEKYRKIKTKYEEVEQDLEPLKEIFEKLFKNIDKKFSEFESYIETAQFDEAKETLPPLVKVLNEVQVILERLPNYLFEVNQNIPKNMGATIDRYHSLVESGLPLNHLNIEKTLEQIKNCLIDIRNKFNTLAIGNLDSTINGLKSSLEQINEKMSEEEKARNEFKEKYDTVISNYSEVEKNIIKLHNSIPQFEKYYIIDETNQSILLKINDDLDILSKVKRRVDYFVHGIQKTYYTDLVQKILDLENGVNELNEKYLSFKAFLDSLKVDVDGAFKLINETYLKLKSAESTLRNFENDELKASFNEDFNHCYNSLDVIQSLLKSLPINVNEVNNAAGVLRLKSSELFKSIDELNNYLKLSNENILLINRERYKFADVHNLLNQVETLYFSGQYKESYEMSESILKKIELKEKVAK